MSKPMTQQEKQEVYDAWYIAEVEKGLADCDAGNVVPHDLAMQHIRNHLDQLKTQHGKKAA